MEQRTAEWHEMRRKYIGGSDAPVLMGVSPWKTPYELYIEKTSPYVSVPNQNPWMQRGIELEPEALSSFERETGYLMSPKVLFSPKNEFMMASLDGIEIDGKAIVEIKCPGQVDHELALAGVIPTKYVPQLQHIIEVTGLDKIYYCSYSPNHPVKQLYIKEVYRDTAFIEVLIEKEAHFYYEHMLKKIPPDNPKKVRIIDSEQWRRLTDEYKKMDNQEEDAKKRKEEIKDMLIQLADSEPATGNGLSLSKIERKGVIPYSSLPEVKALDLERHRKPGTTFWLVKEANDGMD